jgi:hypothetical protein
MEFLKEGTDVLFREQNESDGTAYLVEVRSDYRALLRLRGAGTMERVHSLLEALDRGDQTIGDCPPMLGAVDIAGVQTAPLRAQFILGRWLLTRRKKFERIAVFEGKPFAMMLGKAAMRIARFKQVGFFKRREDAFAWLDELRPQ